LLYTGGGQHFVGDNCYNTIQYDMGLVETDFKERRRTTITIYPEDVNMTHPPPITNTTIPASLRPSARKRQAHRVYPETWTSANIGAIH